MQQFVAVLGHVDADFAGLQGRDARVEQADQVHGVLGLVGALVLEGVGHAAELAQDVARIGLVDVLREERLPHRPQLLGRLVGQQDQRRPERLQHVGVGLQRQPQELLQLPVDLVPLVLLELQLFRQPPQRPVQPGRGQVDSPQVVVGILGGQPERLGADLAAIDDPGPQVLGDLAQLVFDLPPPQGQLVEVGRHRLAIGETDQVGLPVVRRAFQHHAHAARRLELLAVRQGLGDLQHHLGACRDDEAGQQLAEGVLVLGHGWAFSGLTLAIASVYHRMGRRRTGIALSELKTARSNAELRPCLLQLGRLDLGWELADRVGPRHHPTTNLARCWATPMRAIVPLVNSRKSDSTPSEKMTPPEGMSDSITNSLP